MKRHPYVPSFKSKDFCILLQENEKSFDLRRKETGQGWMDGWRDGCCHGDNLRILTFHVFFARNSERTNVLGNVFLTPTVYTHRH